VITGVTGFGMFVELQDLYVEGMVHISSLGKDYFHFDAAMQRLVGERTGTVYRMGDPIQVTVAAVDMEQRKVDLMLAGGGADRSAKKSVKGKQPPRKKAAGKAKKPRPKSRPRKKSASKTGRAKPAK